MKYYVYILINSDDKIYIGQTFDIKKRLVEHNENGKGYTSKFRPWRLVHQETLNTRADAMKREHYLKTGAGRDWIQKNILRA